MVFGKGNPKRRVYHLPLDGYTQVFNALDFSECDHDDDESLEFLIENRNKDDCCGPSSSPFLLSNSYRSEVNRGSDTSLSPFSLSNSYRSEVDCGSNPSMLRKNSFFIEDRSEIGLDSTVLRDRLCKNSFLIDDRSEVEPDSTVLPDRLCKNSFLIDDRSEVGPNSTVLPERLGKNSFLIDDRSEVESDSIAFPERSHENSFLIDYRSEVDRKLGSEPSSFMVTLSNSSSVNNESEDEYCGLRPTSLTFSFSNSSSIDDYGAKPSSLTFSFSNSSSIDDHYEGDRESGPSSSFSLSKSSSLSISSSKHEPGPTSLTFSLSNSSSGDDHFEDADPMPSSLPFWMISKSSSVGEKSQDSDTNRLLAGENNNSNGLSFGFQSFSEGKRFMKEVFENIPDSLYELSFRDIIDEDLAIFGSLEEEEDEDDDIIIEEDDHKPKTNFCINHETKKMKKKKKLSRNDVIISRNQRMNTAVFLLKMFVPIPLRSKTKSKSSRKYSKIIPGTSFDLIENSLSKQISQRLHKNNSKGIDGFSNITTQKRLIGGKLLSCFCKMSDSQRYISNALLNDGCNK